MERVNTSRPRRIMLLARGGPLDGSQRQLVYLVGGLDRSRYEPIVVLDRLGPLTDCLLDRDIEVHVMPMRPWRSFPGGLMRYIDALRIARLGRRRRAELVHASDMTRSRYMHFISRRLGIPSVLHVRGPMSQRDIVKHKMARASAVVAIAQRYHQDLLGAGISPRCVELIDDAVDLEQFRPGLSGRDYLQRQFSIDGRVLVGLVGRIEPFKRVVEFLEMIAPLARNPGGSEAFLVIGRPKQTLYYRTVLDAARRLGLEQRVVFAGHCRDMPRTMSALDVLVTMSGGSVMFEAMACAKPVLSVSADGRHSVHTRHGETAWCVTAAGPAPATAALARLIDDEPLRRRLGESARAWAERYLSPATLADRTQALYDRLVVA